MAQALGAGALESYPQESRGGSEDSGDDDKPPHQPCRHSKGACVTGDVRVVLGTVRHLRVHPVGGDGG